MKSDAILKRKCTSGLQKHCPCKFEMPVSHPSSQLSSIQRTEYTHSGVMITYMVFMSMGLNKIA